MSGIQSYPDVPVLPFQDELRLKQDWQRLLLGARWTFLNELFGSIAELAVEELGFSCLPNSVAQELYSEVPKELAALGIIVACCESEKRQFVDPSRWHLPLWRLVDDDIPDDDSPTSEWFKAVENKYPLTDILP